MVIRISLPEFNFNLQMNQFVNFLRMLAFFSLAIFATCKKETSIEQITRAAQLNEKGANFLGQGKYDRALSSFSEAYSLNPALPEYSNNIGVVLLQMNRPEEALKYFILSAKTDKSYSRAQYNQGVCYQKLGDNRNAIEAYMRTLTIIPNTPEVYFNLGIVYTRSGNKKLAKESFEKFIAIAPAQFELQIRDARRKIEELLK